MSEFNIKQQNRNRFTASKAKKANARSKETDKLFRDQYAGRQLNASESSDSIDVPIETKSISRSERRRNREKRNEENPIWNQAKGVSHGIDKSATHRKLDNPSPCTSESLETNHDYQSTKENNPTMSSSSQNVQKANRQKDKVSTSDGQQKKQPKPSDQPPKMPKKDKSKKKQQKNTAFEPHLPVPKLMKTNFQWFNPSPKEAVDDDNNEQPSNQSNSSFTNKSSKGQPNSHAAHKGHTNQHPAPFTTAGLSQDEMKTVRGLFSEPSSSKHSIDSDLSNKYDCSKDKPRNKSWRSESSYQENNKIFPGFKIQQSFRPITDDKLKEDYLTDDSRNSQKYGKRAIKSHANRNYDLPEYEGANDQDGEEFDDLCGATFSVSSHFLMKEQKEWIQQSESCINPFALNLKCLAAGLNTVPFHERQSLPENLFTSDEISRMISEASSKMQTYEAVQKEAEEEMKTSVFRESDDSILKDDFISDFLTCGDSLSTDKSNSKDKVDKGIAVGEAWNFTLKLELDDDGFDSPFVPSTNDEQPAKRKKNKNKNSKKDSNKEKTINGNSSDHGSSKSVERRCSTLESGSGGVSRLLESSDDEWGKIKLQSKYGAPSGKTAQSGVGKMSEKFVSKQYGEQSQSPSQSTEKRSPADGSASTFIFSAKAAQSGVGKMSEKFVSKQNEKLSQYPSESKVKPLDGSTFISKFAKVAVSDVEKMSEQIVSGQDVELSQSPPQNTEKRARVRGSSAFNITESLSGLLAEKSIPQTASSNKIGSLHVESPSHQSSCETSGKSPSAPYANKLGSFEKDFKNLTIDSPTDFKFDFKLSTSTSLSKTNEVFQTKNYSPLPSKTSDSFDSKAKKYSPAPSKTSDSFKTKIFCPSPLKTSHTTFESKSNPPLPSKISCNFDFKTKDNSPTTQVTNIFEFKSNDKFIPSMEIATPAVNIVNKKSDSTPICSNSKESSSLASESPSSSHSRPVIDDDEMDILLGITNIKPNRESSSSDKTDNECLPSGSKGNLQSTNQKPSTSMLDENLDDWLDSVLQS